MLMYLHLIHDRTSCIYSENHYHNQHDQGVGLDE